jgi:hypothetical protein
LKDDDSVQEEAGIIAPLEQCGVLLCCSESQDFAHLIYIFRANQWENEPAEYVMLMMAKKYAIDDIIGPKK